MRKEFKSSGNIIDVILKLLILSQSDLHILSNSEHRSNGQQTGSKTQVAFHRSRVEIPTLLMNNYAKSFHSIENNIFAKY